MSILRSEGLQVGQVGDRWRVVEFPSRGGGGALRILSDRMGEKVKTQKNSRDQKLTQKNSHAKFPSLEISRKNYKITHVVLNLAVLYSQNYAAGMRGHYRESSDCFE